MNPRSNPSREYVGTQVFIYRKFWYPARRDQRISLHFGDCRHCNDGRGKEGNTPLVAPDHPIHPIRDFPKSAWIGPFGSIGAANAWVASFPYAAGRIAVRCSDCCRVPDRWPPR